MADAPAPEQKHAPEFPAANFPTVFADSVVSMANSSAHVKIFFGRFEPDMWGGGENRIQPFAQVIMPMLGFVQMFTFFEHQLNAYLAQKLITQDQIDEFRKLHAATRK